MKKFLTMLLLCGCSSVNQISTSNHIVQENAIKILDTQDITIAHKHAEIILGETKDIADAPTLLGDIVIVGLGAVPLLYPPPSSSNDNTIV